MQQSPDFERARSKTIPTRTDPLTRHDVVTKAIAALRKSLNNRSLTDKLVVHQLLQSVEYFQRLLKEKASLIYDISEALTYNYYEKDRIIFKNGDVGDKFYLILRGRVSVMIKLPNEENQLVLKEISQLSDGQQFGELALGDLNIRSATIMTITDCHLASLDKAVYQKLIGSYNQQLIQNKIDFLGNYDFFSNWSMREMKSLTYEFQEFKYSYGDRINMDNCIGFLESGQIQIQKIIEAPAFGEHPLKAVKITKQTLKLEVLSKFALIGELNYEEKSKDSYYYFCYSNHVKLYKLHLDTIEQRFYDPKTKKSFNIKIQQLLRTRLQKANEAIQEFHQQYEAKIQQQKLDFMLQEIRKKSPQRTKTPQKNPRRAIRTITVDDEPDEFREFRLRVKNKLSSGSLYKYQQINKLEERSAANKSTEKEYDQLISREKQAQEKFKKISESLGCKLHRIKSYFYQRKIDQNKLYYQLI